MAFGSEILLLLGAGFVVLGPKRMQAMIGQIGRAKAQFDKASRCFMSEISDQLADQTDAKVGNPDSSQAEAHSE